MRPQLLTQVRQTVGEKVEQFRNQRLFADKLSLTFLIIALGLNALALGLLVFKLNGVEGRVPVRYTSVGDIDLGSTLQLYGLGLASLAITLGNSLLAVKCFNRSRIASLFLLIGASVVALFTLMICRAFTGGPL